MSESLTRKEKTLRLLPAAGALAGGAHGLAKSKGSGKARAAKAVLHAGVGATTGWLPDIFDKAHSAMKTKTAAAFFDEMGKIAARMRVMHGSNAAYKTLKPRSATGKSAVLATDPNMAAVYMATKRRSAKGGVKAFASRAAQRHGGAPHIGITKVDTKKGWRPHSITTWAKKEGYGLEDLTDMAEDLDAPGTTKSSRGELWKMLNRGVGAWRNVNPAAEVKGLKWRRA